MDYYINRLFNNGEIKNFTILILLMITFSNPLYSTEIDVDTTAFFKAKEKFTNCTSGTMNYRLNYVTLSFELYWDIEMHFVKNNENKISFYVKQYEDTMTSEYVYYNDTLLIFAEYANEVSYAKHHTNKPFEGNIRGVFTYLLNEQNLTNFLTYDKVKLYDTILSPNSNNVRIGEASSFKNSSRMESYYNSKIVINKTNNNLVSCFDKVVVYRDSILYYKGYKEYLIDTISLYREKNKDIEYKIKTKYNELDSIIVSNLEVKKDSIIKDSIKEIPEYAFEWKLPLTNGDTLNSKDIHSKILVLDFYYMSCGPCVLAIYDLIKLDNLYNENDVTFVGANVADNNLSKINKFLEDKKIKYRNVLGAKNLSDKYGFNNFPQILFIDTKTNKILYHSTGYRSDGINHYKVLLDGFLDN